MAKNKNDTRYLKSEKKLLGSFLYQVRKTGIGLKVGDISRGAGLAASTFYRHYKSLKIMTGHTEKKIVREYETILRRVERSGGTMEDLMDCTTGFIMRNWELFYSAARIDYVGIYRRITDVLWGFIAKGQSNYGAEMNIIKVLYCYEIIGVLMTWVENDARERWRCNRRLVLLSKKCAQRLSFMIK